MAGSGSRTCSGITVDGVERDAGAVAQAFEDRMNPEVPGCSEVPADAGLTPLAARTRAVRVCGDGVDRALTAEQVEVLSRDFWGPHEGRQHRSCGTPAPARRVLTADARGVVTSWTDEGCADVLRTDGAVWAVGDEALRVIDEALRRR